MTHFLGNDREEVGQASGAPSNELLLAREWRPADDNTFTSQIYRVSRVGMQALSIDVPEIGEISKVSAAKAQIIFLHFDNRDVSVIGVNRSLVFSFVNGAIVSIQDVDPSETNLVWLQSGQMVSAGAYFHAQDEWSSARFDRFDPESGIAGLQAIGGLSPINLIYNQNQDTNSARTHHDKKELENLSLAKLFTPKDDTVDFAKIIAGSYLEGSQYDALGGDDVVILPTNLAAALQAGYDLVHSFHANAGNDFIVGSEDPDTIFGDEGGDIIQGRKGDDTLDGGLGADSLMGEDGQDTLLGAEGDDFLFGGDGIDWLYGGEGNDRLYGEGDDDFIYGEGGDDLIEGGSGDDILYGSDGNDLVAGGAGMDRVSGGSGKDALYGQTGSDMIEGGKDSDMLFGGADADVFRFYAGDGGGSLDGADILWDFEDGIDRLFYGNAFDFNKVFLQQDGADTILIYDNEYLAVLKGIMPAQISAADFV